MSAEIFDETWKTLKTPEATRGPDPRSRLFSCPSQSMVDRYLDELMLHDVTRYSSAEKNFSLETMLPRPESKTTFASLLHKAYSNQKREAERSTKSQHVQNMFQTLLDDINDAKSAIQQFKESEDAILTMPSSITVFGQDTTMPNIHSSGSVTIHPSKTVFSPATTAEISSKAAKLSNKVTLSSNKETERSFKEALPNRFQALLDKYQPMLDKIEARSRTLGEETDDTIVTIPSSTTATTQDDISDIYDIYDVDDMGTKKEFEFYQSCSSLKNTFSEESTEPDDTVAHEFLQALPEVTKLMNNVTISPGIKNCINNALSQMIDEESKKIREARLKRLEAQSMGYGSGKYDQHFDEFYNYREPISVADRPNTKPGSYISTLKSNLPKWFVDLFDHGPVTVNLHGTFPEGFADSIDDVKTATEYKELSEANFAITISYSDILEKFSSPCPSEIFVEEHIHFPPAQLGESSTVLQSSHTLLTDLFGCDVISVLRAQWRKEYSCSFSGSEPCRCNRVPFMASHVERPSSYVLGSKVTLGWEKNFHLVFMQTGSGQRRHVCGTYRRQMSTSDKFMTWRFRIK